VAKFFLYLFDAVFLAQQRFQIQLKCMVITDPYRAGRVSDLHFFILQSHRRQPERLGGVEQAHGICAFVVVRRLNHHGSLAAL
jgi:hypothetical protein